MPLGYLMFPATYSDITLLFCHRVFLVKLLLVLEVRPVHQVHQVIHITNQVMITTLGSQYQGVQDHRDLQGHQVLLEQGRQGTVQNILMRQG